MAAAPKPDLAERAFYERSALDVGPDLLNKVLVTADGLSGRIVEVEAYLGSEDPGSHGYRGMTPRTEPMFGPAAHLYVYFSYGMHWCANVVCMPSGECSAVLIRALEPLSGHDEMYERRAKAKRNRDLCSGPAKLCQALAIDGQHDGLDLLGPRAAVSIIDDGTPPPQRPERTVRIGLAKGKGEDLPWRFTVPDSPWLSR